MCSWCIIIWLTFNFFHNYKQSHMSCFKLFSCMMQLQHWMDPLCTYNNIVIKILSLLVHLYTLPKKCFSSLFRLQILKRPEGVEGRLISHYLMIKVNYTTKKKLLLNFQNSQMKKRGETLFGECSAHAALHSWMSKCRVKQRSKVKKINIHFRFMKPSGISRGNRW